jgi:hypothetical protein
MFMSAADLRRSVHQTSPPVMSANAAEDGALGMQVSLLLMMITLTPPKASSMLGSMAEIVLKEEKVYAHLDEEKEHNAGA